MKRTILVAACSVLVVAGGVAAGRGVSTSIGQAASAPKGDAEHGREIYDKYACYSCHGYEGQGGGGTGPRVGPDVLPWGGYVKAIRTPRSAMPPYTDKVVTDQELADIYAFLKARPEPPKDIPLLDDEEKR